MVVGERVIQIKHCSNRVQHKSVKNMSRGINRTRAAASWLVFVPLVADFTCAKSTVTVYIYTFCWTVNCEIPGITAFFIPIWLKEIHIDVNETNKQKLLCGIVCNSHVLEGRVNSVSFISSLEIELFWHGRSNRNGAVSPQKCLQAGHSWEVGIH